MAGNVWEWTDSWYDEKQERKELRGGSWGSLASDLRASGRLVSEPVFRLVNFGFRVAREVSVP